MLRNIFADPTSPSSSVYEPRPSTSDPPPPPPDVDPALSIALVAILEAPPRHGETIATNFARKEQALYAILATLDIPASRLLHTRLSSDPHPSDPLTLHFHRLTSDRRGRLLAYLSDVRRRHAIRGRR